MDHLLWDDRSSLPTEPDFDPCGQDLDGKAAWSEFGGMTLSEAFEKFREEASIYSEDFMFMGDRAFAFYFPVIDRYLREFQRTPRDDWPISGAWILGRSVAFHFEGDGQLSDAPVLRPLVPRIRELARWMRDHLPQFTMDADEQRHVDDAWKDLEATLAKPRWS